MNRGFDARRFTALASTLFAVAAMAAIVLGGVLAANSQRRFSLPVVTGSGVDDRTDGSAVLLYGVSNGYNVPADNRIYQIDPANGTISNAQVLTLAGFTITNTQALAARPSDNALFAVVQAGGRRLVTVNPATGVCTDIGSLSGRAFSSLAFRANGNLYGVTGDGDPSFPETLYLISTLNASLTTVTALGNGNDGETIAFAPDGFLYHASGAGVASIFERVNVDTFAVTPLGSNVGQEAFAMGYSTSASTMYLSDVQNNLWAVNLGTGARTFVATINSLPERQLGITGNNRGLAFANPPTAANVSLSGRVATADGRGITKAQVTVSGGTLTEPRMVLTSAFGYYTFEGLEAGQTYVVTVGSKRFTFAVPSRVVTLSDTIGDVDFVAEP